MFETVRLILVTGSNHMYILVNPTSTEKSEGTPENVDWEFAQKEIAQAKGFATGFGSGLSKGNHISILVFNMRIFTCGKVLWPERQIQFSCLCHNCAICHTQLIARDYVQTEQRYGNLPNELPHVLNWVPNL